MKSVAERGHVRVLCVCVWAVCANAQYFIFYCHFWSSVLVCCCVLIHVEMVMKWLSYSRVCTPSYFVTYYIISVLIVYDTCRGRKGPGPGAHKSSGLFLPARMGQGTK